MKIIDLSIPVEDGLPSDPPPQVPHIEYLRHKDTAQVMTTYFNGGISVSDLPEGNGWAIENVRLTTHSGTHLDAPYHFYPTMNNGERAWTIDEIPLEWCIGNGVKIRLQDQRGRRGGLLRKGGLHPQGGGHRSAPDRRGQAVGYR